MAMDLIFLNLDKFILNEEEIIPSTENLSAARCNRWCVWIMLSTLFKDSNFNLNSWNMKTAKKTKDDWLLHDSYSRRYQ